MDDKQVEKLLNEMSKIPEKGGLFPRESIRAAVIAEMSRASVWKRLINYRIPVYQLAAAVILVLLGFAGVTFLKSQKRETVVIQNPRPVDYGLIKSSTIRIGMNVRQDRLKTLCDSLLL